MKTNFTHFLLRVISIRLLLITLTLSLSMIPLLRAQENSKFPEVFTLNSKPFGIPYAEWTARWWQWALSIPDKVNPITDLTGEHCSEDQKGPVWFLGGTWGGSAERTCTIPAGKAILWAPINYSCSPAEFPELNTEAELRQCTKEPMDKVIAVGVKINGTNSPNLKEFRVQSPVFNFSYPEGNVIGKPPQKTFGVSDGYWIFLKPLTPGKYEIESTGTYLSPDPSTGTPTAFSNTVRYHLVVIP